MADLIGDGVEIDGGWRGGQVAQGCGVRSGGKWRGFCFGHFSGMLSDEGVSLCEVAWLSECWKATYF